MFYCEGAVASWNNPQLNSPIKEVVALPPGGTGFESESCVEPKQDNSSSGIEGTALHHCESLYLKGYTTARTIRGH